MTWRYVSTRSTHVRLPSFSSFWRVSAVAVRGLNLRLLRSSLGVASATLAVLIEVRMGGAIF